MAVSWRIESGLVWLESVGVWDASAWKDAVDAFLSDSRFQPRDGPRSRSSQHAPSVQGPGYSRDRDRPGLRPVARGADWQGALGPGGGRSGELRGRAHGAVAASRDGRLSRRVLRPGRGRVLGSLGLSSRALRLFDHLLGRDGPSGDPRRRWHLWLLSRKLLAVVVGSALIQAALCALPDAMGDVLSYRLWARALAQEGLAEAYWPSHPLVLSANRLDVPIDYPPLFPYALMGIGKAGALWGVSDAGLDALVRLPLVLASLTLGLLLAADARRRGDETSATLAAALFLLNPGVIFDTAYWGQADALVALFVVATVVALQRGRFEWGGAIFALAVLTKPLAYPFAPFVLVLSVKRAGWARTLVAVGVCGLTVLVVLLRFLWIGRLGSILRSLVSQLEALPYASVNAHNLWWLVQRGTPWLDAREEAVGSLSYEAIGIALVAGFCLATLFQLWRSEDERAERLAFASTAFGFFVLATHMHENHLFNAIPLIVLAGAHDRRMRHFLALVSAVFLANMLLHDPALTHVFRGLAPGRRLLLPLAPGLDPRFFDYFLAHGYASVVEGLRGETSALGVWLTVINAQAAVLCFAAWLWSFYRRPGFDAALREPESPFPWRVALLGRPLDGGDRRCLLVAGPARGQDGDGASQFREPRP